MVVALQLHCTGRSPAEQAQNGPKSPSHGKSTSPRDAASGWCPKWRPGDTWFLRVRHRLFSHPKRPWSAPSDWRFRVQKDERWEDHMCHVVLVDSSNSPGLSIKLLFRATDLQLVHGTVTDDRESAPIVLDAEHPGPEFVEVANVPLAWPHWPLPLPADSSASVFRKNLFSSVGNLVAIADHQQRISTPEEKTIAEWQSLQKTAGRPPVAKHAVSDARPVWSVALSDGTKTSTQLWAPRVPWYLFMASDWIQGSLISFRRSQE